MLTWLLELAGRLRAFFRPGSFDRDFDQELEAHLNMLAEDYRRRGLTPEQALREARLKLGGFSQLREAHREVRGMPLVSASLQDLRYALRTLRRTPGFTATALAALALGIGATTAVFSLVNAVLLRPVPVPNPDSFVMLMTTSVSRAGQSDSSPGASPEKFVHWRAESSVLQDVSAYMPGVMNYTGSEIVEQLRSVQMSAGTFRCWGTPMLLGRGFRADDDAPGGPRVALIGDDFWRRDFAGDPRIFGKGISLNGEVYTVLGIAANSPFLLEQGPPPDVYVPFQLDPNSTDPASRFRVTARLKPGVSLKQANARLQASAAAFRARFPKELGPKDGFSAVPYRDFASGAWNTGGTRPLLLVLLGAVALVLLIACANVANLLLVRAGARRREIAIRVAIGAWRGRVIRQLLTESLLLSLAGGVLGLLLGFAGIRALLAVNTAGLPRLGENGVSVGLDWRVMGFTVLVSLLTGILFGLIPALGGSRVDLNSVLKDSSARSGTGLKRNKARAALVVSEVGLAVVLLVGSALLLRTFVALYSVNPGFDSKNVIIMQALMTGPQYKKAAGVADSMRAGLERIRALPGVAFASATYFVPLETAIDSSFNVVGEPTAQGPFGGLVPVASGYFEVFKIPVKRGRTFNDRDDDKSPPVVVINQSMAKRYWKDADPLKDRIVIGKGSIGFQGEPARQIVGIVEDVRDTVLNRDPRPTMYVPQAQITDAMNAFLVHIQPVAWIVRTRTQPHALVPAIREQLRRATRLPASDGRLMDQIVSGSIAKQRFNMLLMTVFGCAALLLAAIGIYGLMAYSVEQRTQEIGIRLALGADASQMRNRIVWQGMRLALAGVAIGLVLAFGLTRFLASFLFGVHARDPVVFLTVPIVLSVVALLAVWLPASRASHIDPIEALRYE